MIVVSDTSPLTALLEIGRGHLLAELFGRVVIPPAVQTELLREHPALPDWIEVEVPGPIPPRITDARLDAGETQALALALKIHADTILMDERLGRRVAEALGLRPTGVLGCLVLAKREGFIRTVAPVIAELQSIAGCWFDNALLAAVLHAAGEAA